MSLQHITGFVWKPDVTIWTMDGNWSPLSSVDLGFVIQILQWQPIFQTVHLSHQDDPSVTL